MSTLVHDPLDDAVQVAESAGQFFGKFEIDGQWVILRKGERKRVWVEGDDLDGRQSEITIRLNPLDISGLTRLIERQILANSREWSNIVWPSLRDLGVKALREINGKYGQIALVPSGREWTNKDGELVKGSTFRFIALHDTEAECVAAWEQAFGGSGKAHSTPVSAPSTATAAAPNDAEKAVAAQFLPSLVKMAGGDLVKLQESLSTMAPVNKYFTLDSPEVVALLKAA